MLGGGPAHRHGKMLFLAIECMRLSAVDPNQITSAIPSASRAPRADYERLRVSSAFDLLSAIRFSISCIGGEGGAPCRLSLCSRTKRTRVSLSAGQRQHRYRSATAAQSRPNVRSECENVQSPQRLTASPGRHNAALTKCLIKMCIATDETKPLAMK